jgi:hypothetical protein
MPEVNQRSASTLLSIGVIALEQMLVQNLAPGSIRYGAKSTFGKDLQRMAEVIGNSTLVESVQAEAQRIDVPGAVFGRQRAECENLLETVRSQTGINIIIDIIQSGEYNRFETDTQAQTALMNMRAMSTVINESAFASDALRRGKGINAGIDIIIAHYCPQLLQEAA